MGGQQHGEADGHELRDVRDRALVPAGRGAQSQDMIMRMMSRNNTSEKLLEQIDDAVKKVPDEAYATALKQISDNREAMDKVVRSCARRRPCRATSSAPSWPSTR